MSLSLRRRLSRRAAVVAIASTLGVAGLSACGQLPSTAATVGDQTISVDEVRAETQDSLDDPVVGDALEAYGESTIRSFVLNQLVQVELVRQIAADNDIEIDEDAALQSFLAGSSIEDFQAQQGLSTDMIEREALIQYVVGQLGLKSAGQSAAQIQAQIESQIRAQYAADPMSAKDWQLSIMVASSEAEADAWIGEIQGGQRTMEEIGATLPQDQQTGQFQPQQVPYNTREGTPNPELDAQIGAIPVGEVGKLILSAPDPNNPANVQSVVYVVRVDSMTVAGDAEIAAQAQQQAEEQFSSAGDAAAAEAAKDISITVNPRLGTVEHPEQGLPGVSAPVPSTFSEPAAPAGEAGIPGMGG